MHGGATNGQLSAFLMIPSRDFAITILTNADEGVILHDTVVSWALNHYLGLKDAEITHIDLPTGKLSEYVGTYDAQLAGLELSMQDDQLIVHMTPHGGFPDVSSPPGPPPPPTRLGFFGPDLAITLDEPLINIKIEFLRGDDGRVEWLRTSRLHRKIA